MYHLASWPSTIFSRISAGFFCVVSSASSSAFLAASDVGRDRLDGRVRGRQAGDLHGEVADELLEVVVAGHEVRLAVDLDEHAQAAAGVDVGGDLALAGVAPGLARRRPPGPWPSSSAMAASRSPPVSSRARLQSMKPAPVRSRSSLTSAGLIVVSAMLVVVPSCPGRVVGVPRGRRRIGRRPCWLGRAAVGSAPRCGWLASVASAALGWPRSAAAAASPRRSVPRRLGGLGRGLWLCGRGLGRLAGSRLAGAGCSSSTSSADGRLAGQEGLGAAAASGRPRPAAGLVLVRLGHEAVRAAGRDGGHDLVAGLLGLADVGTHGRLLGRAGGALREALDGGVGDQPAEQPDGADGVVVGGDDVVDLVRVDVRVTGADDRDLQPAGLGDGDVLALRVDDEDGARQAAHLAHAAQLELQAGHLLEDAGGFLLGRRSKSPLACLASIWSSRPRRLRMVTKLVSMPPSQRWLT